MAFTSKEREARRRDQGRNSYREYVLRGSGTEADARTQLLTDAPTVVGTKVLQVSDTSVEEVAPGVFIGVAAYADPQWSGSAKEPDTFEISFEVAGTVQRITQSRATVASYTRSGSFQRSFGGAIGVRSDGEVEGCDVLVPTTGYTVNYSFPSDQFTDGTYIRKIITAVGSVNSDTFQGLAAGEGLLTRVSGRRRADGGWDVAFTFAVSLNETGLTIGEITGIAKKGWEYLWVYYSEDVRTAGGVNYTTKLPVHAYVEQVYRASAYADLGLT